MATKFSEDVVPLMDLKRNPGRVVRHATETRRPVLLTSRGHPDVGGVVAEFTQPFLRELVHASFRIVYRRDPRQVRIVRVWGSGFAGRAPPEA